MSFPEKQALAGATLQRYHHDDRRYNFAPRNDEMGRDFIVERHLGFQSAF